MALKDTTDILRACDMELDTRKKRLKIYEDKWGNMRRTNMKQLAYPITLTHQTK